MDLIDSLVLCRCKLVSGRTHGSPRLGVPTTLPDSMADPAHLPARPRIDVRVLRGPDMTSQAVCLSRMNGYGRVLGERDLAHVRRIHATPMKATCPTVAQGVSVVTLMVQGDLIWKPAVDLFIDRPVRRSVVGPPVSGLVDHSGPRPALRRWRHLLKQGCQNGLATAPLQGHASPSLTLTTRVARASTAVYSKSSTCVAVDPPLHRSSGYEVEVDARRSDIVDRFRVYRRKRPGRHLQTLVGNENICRCGHALRVHDHFRRGTDCGACGKQVCAHFRHARLLHDWWTHLTRGGCRGHGGQP